MINASARGAWELLAERLTPFREAIALREQGMDVTLVCSASEEQDALVALADVVLDGPDDVAAWLGDLADRFAPV